MNAAPSIPFRVAVVQRTLPRYRIPTYRALIDAAAPGSIVLHGRVQSSAQPKQNAFLGNVPFAREALPCWSASLRIGEQLIYPVYLPGLARALARHRPEVVITEGESNFINNFAVVRYARRSGVPYIWWGLGAIPGGRPSGLRRIFGGLLKRMIRNAGGIACYSSYAREFYISEGAAPERCAVVPNVLDHAETEAGIARYRPEARDFRRASGVGDGDIVLLSVGALEGPKRIPIALEALRELQGRSDRRIHYWIVGDGPDRQVLEARVRDLALRNVRFWGPHYDDVSLYFLASDLFVLPGLGGLSINQAMMHGLPVVCGPADGTERDLLVGDRHGRLLDNVTPTKLADAISDLAGQDISAIGAEAKAYLATNFSLASQTAALANLVAMACRKGRP